MKLNKIIIALLVMSTLTGCGQVGKVKKGSTEAATPVVDAKQQASLDTLYWMNGTYGILILRNGLDYKYLGGVESKDAITKQRIQQSLKDSWDINSREDLDSTIQWLLDEGHNASMMQEYKEMGLDQYSREEVASLSKEDSVAYNLCIYDAVTTYEDNAILAWDLSRAIQLAIWGYEAGYYEYDEAIEKSLEISKNLQQAYDSWDNMMASYFYGYQYWSEGDPEDANSEAYARHKLYEESKKDKDSPYQLDYKMPLDIEYALANDIEVLR